MVNNTQQSELGLILLSIQGELRSIGDVQRRLRAVEKSLREKTPAAPPAHARKRPGGYPDGLPHAGRDFTKHDLPNVERRPP